MIFCALGPGLDDLPDSWMKCMADRRFYVIGNKKFGLNNGLIYRYRGNIDYFDTCVNIDDAWILSNKKYKQKYGERYIDMLSVVLASDSRVKVFTDDQKFISNDCIHLSQAGAKYYSSALDLDGIIK